MIFRLRFLSPTPPNSFFKVYIRNLQQLYKPDTKKEWKLLNTQNYWQKFAFIVAYNGLTYHGLQL